MEILMNAALVSQPSLNIIIPTDTLGFSNCPIANNVTATGSLLSKTLLLSWCRHQMETMSALLAICAGNSPVPGEFPAQRPVTRSFDVFFDLRLNKRLSKQSWGWWFETLSCPLWRHSNVWSPVTSTHNPVPACNKQPHALFWPAL